MYNHFKTLAGYNRWANAKLFEAVTVLSDADFNKDCHVAFTSINGTLNHVLVGDLIWLSRFEGKSPKGLPTRLNQILYQLFIDLWQARQKLDDDIIVFVERLDNVSLQDNFSYRPVTVPQVMTQTLASGLAHLFNHQTHHRGQCHAMLTRLTGEAPSLDLIYYQRDLKLVSAKGV